MFSRPTVREIAMQAHSLAVQNERDMQMHREECVKTRDLTRQDIKEVRDDLAVKHKENQEFQRKVLYSVIGLLALTVGKFLADSFHFAVHLGQ